MNRAQPGGWFRRLAFETSWGAIGIDALPPIGLAVITAHLAVWGPEPFRETHDNL